MAFDWLGFLNRYGIRYVDSGRNVRRNNVSIACPFCGDDPSENMGISLNGKGFNCWRNESHKGVTPHRLIQVLIGCGYEEAARIISQNDGTFATTDDTFKSDAYRMLGISRLETGITKISGTLNPLPEFRSFYEGGLCRSMFYPYLVKRGYPKKDIMDLAERFEFHYTLRGVFSHRIIIPVIVKSKWRTWTGRTVAPNETLRYLTLPHDSETAARWGISPALSNIKHTLFDYDQLKKGGDVLVVTEGPFDAIRITYFGERYGIRATCLYGKAASAEQIDLLSTLVDKYEKQIVVFDKDAFDAVIRLPDYLGFRPNYLPARVKDPGELTFESFRQTFNI